MSHVDYINRLKQTSPLPLHSLCYGIRAPTRFAFWLNMYKEQTLKVSQIMLQRGQRG